MNTNEIRAMVESSSFCISVMKHYFQEDICTSFAEQLSNSKLTQRKVLSKTRKTKEFKQPQTTQVQPDNNADADQKIEQMFSDFLQKNKMKTQLNREKKIIESGINNLRETPTLKVPQPSTVKSQKDFKEIADQNNIFSQWKPKQSLALGLREKLIEEENNVQTPTMDPQVHNQSRMEFKFEKQDPRRKTEKLQAVEKQILENEFRNEVQNIKEKQTRVDIQEQLFNKYIGVKNNTPQTMP